MNFRLDWHQGRWLALLLLSCSPLAARNTACTAVWSSVADRLTENRFDEETALLQLKFTELPELVFIEMGKVPEPELESHLPAYVRDLLARHPEISVPEVLAEAKSLPFDSESRLRQESDYWHLRYQHFWGGGLQHPRLIRRLAVLEVRAGYVDAVSGRDVQRAALADAVFAHQSHKLTTGDLAERLEAVSRLAELGDERSLDLLAVACRNDPKLAVRASSRLVLLARGRPVIYDPEVLRDIRASRFGEGEEGYVLAHEELARLENDALRGFLENSFLKIMDTEHAELLFANRSAEFIAEYLMHGDTWIRGLALKGLEGRYEAHLLPHYERALRDSNPVVIMMAVGGLSKRHDPASREMLREVQSNHRDMYVRNLAGRYLASTAGREWIPDADLTAALTGPDKAAALRAASVLSSRTLGVLERAIHSPYSEVRLAAAKALGERRDPQALRLARIAFDPAREPVVEVRLAALDALFASRTIDADLLIHKAHSDPNVRVREAVMRKAKEDSVLHSLASQPHHLAQQLVRTEKKHLAQFEGADVRSDHLVAREAAEHVYGLPEPSTAKDSEVLVNEHMRFLAGVPRGQKIVLAGSDPKTGFKYYYSVPRQGFESQRRVFSVAGTEGLIDVYADVNMGRPQLDSPLYQRAKEQLLKDLAAGYDIDITGHSLGGLPAGVLAYELQVARASMQNPGKVRLITWNGLGAKDVLQWRGDFKPEVADALDATNYHLPGDVVWRLGNRLGRDITLPGNAIFRPISSHLMAAINRALDGGAGLHNAQPVQREARARVGPFIAKHFGWIGNFMQSVHYQATEMTTLRKLLQARLEWARREGFREHQHG